MMLDDSGGLFLPAARFSCWRQSFLAGGSLFLLAGIGFLAPADPLFIFLGGYWRAKTSNFTDPDVLISEYAKAGIESLEYDLGYQAAEILKKEYKGAFEKRVKEISDEEAPLAESVEEKQAARRVVLKNRVKRSTITFLTALIPTAVLLVLTIVFGLGNFTTRENTFVLPTILCGVGFVIFFIAFIVFANKLINDLRMRAANEKLTSTEDGKRLVELREYKDLYLALLKGAEENEKEEVEAEE